MKNYIQKQDKHLAKLKEDEAYIAYFIDFAVENLRVNLEETKAVTEAAYRICQQYQYKWGQREMLVYLGWCAHDAGLYEEAIMHYMQARALMEDANDYEGLGKVYSALVVCYMGQGAMREAVRCGQKIIKIIDHMKDESRIVAALLNTSLIYFQIEAWRKVEELIDRIYEMDYEINTQTQLFIDVAMASVYVKTGRIEEAATCAQNSLKVIKEKEMTALLSEVYQVFGAIATSKQAHEEALKYYEEAAVNAKEYNQTLREGECIISIGECLCEMGAVEKGKKYLEEGLVKAEELKSSLLLKKCHHSMSVLYKKTEEWEKAFYHLEQYSVYHTDFITIQESEYYERFDASQELHKEDTYEKLYKRMNSIMSIAKKLTSNLHVDKILEVISEELQLVVRADTLGIAMYDEIHHTLRYNLFIHQGEKVDFGEISLDYEKSIGGYCIKKREDVYIQDIRNEHQKYIADYEYSKYGQDEVRDVDIPKALIYCPLIVEEQVIGVLSLQSTEAYAYGIEDFNMCKILASYIAIALYNAKIFQKVEYLAHYDSLTAALNREAILEKGQLWYETMKDEGAPFSICMVDMDHFKHINDTYGHVVGDRVLKQAITCIKGELLEDCFVGRYGGEEFLIIMPRLAYQEAIAFSERLRQCIAKEPCKLEDGRSVLITASFGVYSCEGYEGDFDKIISQADHTLYEAKDGGRNCVKGRKD
ncbi:MAG: diguanylate cyclase [Cellulosilyticaceae bacterium]